MTARIWKTPTCLIGTRQISERGTESYSLPIDHILVQADLGSPGSAVVKVIYRAILKLSSVSLNMAGR